MKKIGILTSGGDAPGMNAAIRAIVRSSLNKRFNVIGFKNGYDGLIDNKFVSFDRRSVGNIIQHGGSILYTSRSLRFLENKYSYITSSADCSKHSAQNHGVNTGHLDQKYHAIKTQKTCIC